MDVIKNSEEPEWLEKPVVGELRVWQLVFLSLCGMTALSKFALIYKSLLLRYLFTHLLFIS